jgi:ketosteroid isomerase-like protein
MGEDGSPAGLLLPGQGWGPDRHPRHDKRLLRGEPDAGAGMRPRARSLRDTERVMSQENVALTRRAFQAFEDRDLDGLLAVLDHDVEAFPILAGMEGGYRGHDAIRRWWAALLDAFPDFRATIVDLHDFGDLTIAVLRLQGHGAGSATPVDAAAWQVTKFRHGKCITWRVYTSEREALEAAGLSDEPTWSAT